LHRSNQAQVRARSQRGQNFFRHTKFKNNNLPSIKDVRSQWGGGFFRCGRPHFLVQKGSDFSKFMVCPHGQEGLSQCGHFSDKGEGGSIFRERSLWTASKGPSIKDVRSHEGGGFSGADKGRRGSSDARTSAIFGAKHIGFFEIYGVSAQTKGRG